MYRNKIIDDGMYHVLQEWYNFIDNSIHVQADLIGMFVVFSMGAQQSKLIYIFFTF